jgi:ASC-1-like (ASCH) protein
LLQHAEEYAKDKGARQLYCTVAEQNPLALQFFIRNGFNIAGRSDSHYMEGITEIMLYKLLDHGLLDQRFDRMHISVLPAGREHEEQIRSILLSRLPIHFRGIDNAWVDALFGGYSRRATRDINQKYKLIFVGLDRSGTVLGIAGATPKKGTPIKVMPFLANGLPAFVALLTDIPFLLKPYGHKLYIHIIPSVDETIALQQRRWRLDAAMPGAYHTDYVTQQWSLDVKEDFMRMMRVKQTFLDLIRAGKKTLEVRVGYDNIRTIQSGERIRMMSRSQETIIVVDAVRQYATLADMLRAEDAAQIAPGLAKEQVASLLREIYPPDLEGRGVYVLQIHPEV